MNIPNHIAIILDGNGRWAKKRLLPRSAGHKAGSKTLENIADYANQIGVKYLTVYAFSTENWKRPQDEVDALMTLFESYLERSVRELVENNVKMKFIGDTSVFSEKILDLMDKIIELSKECTGATLNICMNYGSRNEITQAVNKLIKQGVTNITEEDIASNLYTAGIPDPDLVIRPSGELRISNFLLWQLAYSEFYFTDTLWPDFTPKCLDLAIEEYNNRNRRFGGV